MDLLLRSVQNNQWQLNSKRSKLSKLPRLKYFLPKLTKVIIRVMDNNWTQDHLTQHALAQIDFSYWQPIWVKSKEVKRVNSILIHLTVVNLSQKLIKLQHIASHQITSYHYTSLNYLKSNHFIWSFNTNTPWNSFASHHLASHFFESHPYHGSHHISFHHISSNTILKHSHEIRAIHFTPNHITSHLCA